MANKNPKGSYFLRIVAGGYLAYLGVSLVRMPFKEETGLPLPVAVGFGVVLAVAGVVCLLNGLKGMKYMQNHPEEFEDPEEGAEEVVEEVPEETTPAPAGIRARASLPEYLQADEAEEEE